MNIGRNFESAAAGARVTAAFLSGFFVRSSSRSVAVGPPLHFVSIGANSRGKQEGGREGSPSQGENMRPLLLGRPILPHRPDKFTFRRVEK